MWFTGLKKGLRKLQPVKLGINPIPGEQFFMGSLLHNPVLGQHQNTLGILDRGETVSDDKSSPVLSQRLQGFLDHLFALIIQG